MRKGMTAAPAAPAGSVEKFELPEEPVLQLPERRPAVSDWRQPEQKRLRLWPKVLSGAALALGIGIAVGYLMVPGVDTRSARAKIESSAMGGTRLRVDYELHER
jgi:hypothetical protein